MRLFLTLLTSAVLLVSIIACSDSFSPTVENVAGDNTLDDTFVKDWPFTARKDRMTIDRTDAEGRFIVILRK